MSDVIPEIAKCSRDEAQKRLKASVARWGGKACEFSAVPKFPNWWMAWWMSKRGKKIRCIFNVREPIFDLPEDKLDEMVHDRMRLKLEDFDD